MAALNLAFPLAGCGNPCGAGTVLQGGQCVPAQPPCGAGTVANGSQCVPGPPPCAPGTTAQNGRCVAVSTSCGPGTQPNQDGHCIPSDGIAQTTPWSANVPVVPSGPADNRVETSLAVDDAGRVYAAFITYPASGTVQGEIQVVVRDPGATQFSAPATMDLTSLRGAGTPFEGDPTAVVDPGGVLHLAWGEYYQDQSGNVTSDIAISSSDDGGKTFTPTVMVNSDDGTVFNDRPWLAVAGDGTLYVSWLSEGASGSYERVARSTDGGATFTELTPIDLNTPKGMELDTWAGPLVAESAQDLLLAADVYDPNGSYIGLTLMATTDGGSTWTEEDLPDPLYDSRDYMFDPRPELVLGPGGRLFLAYIDAPGAHMGVFLTESDDGGQTFSLPLEVSGDDHSAQCLTWMAVDPAGEAHLVWLDNRDGGWRLLYRATTGGATALGPLDAVSDTTFPGSTSYATDPADWLGDFLGFVVRNGHAYATWTDTRGGQGDVYFSEASLP